MALRLILIMVGGVLTATAPAAEPLVLYVAPGGNDAWSGRLAEPNRDHSEGPLATPGRARDAVRDLKRRSGGTLTQPVAVRMRGGTYVLAEPLVFTRDDSGTASCPVTFEAYPNENPVLSGGRRIVGWKETPVDGKPLWATEAPGVKAGTWYFHQLWVNGQRRVRARHPNQGFLSVASLVDVKEDPPKKRGEDRFRFTSGDIKAWANLQDVEVVALHLWVTVRLPVAAVDEHDHLVTFTTRSRRSLIDAGQPARYYVENAFELLDSPGEWYLDRQTGVLYYWPLPGEKMAEAEVVAPVLPQLVRFEGKPERQQTIDYLNFRGLGFMHSEWSLPRHEGGDVQAAVEAAGAVQGDGLRSCRFEDCTFAHLGTYGLSLARGCQQDRVVGCEFLDLGAGGVKVGEKTGRADPVEQTCDNLISDNHIHDGGRVFHQAVGVWVGQSSGNRIAHNHIHDFYYTGVSVGWTWGYGPSLARDNVIEFNHIHDLGKDWLSDMGGVYTLGGQPGTVIRGNVMHDIAGLHYGGWGIYFDEGSSNIVAENNLVYRTTHGGFHQHYGKENVVRNNILALGRDAQLQRTRAEAHLSFTFERNIVYYRTGKLLAGQWDGNVTLDHNLYWNAGGEVRFGPLTFQEWQGKGRDQHSLVADPLFMDPDRADFRLKPGSLAGTVGVTMPDLSDVGPRPAARREPVP